MNDEEAIKELRSLGIDFSILYSEGSFMVTLFHKFYSTQGTNETLFLAVHKAISDNG